MSSIIPKEIENLEDLDQVFWLFFYLKKSKGVEWQEEGLPIPTLIKHLNKGTYWAWAINGFLGTNKSQEFMNDIIARILITFKDLEPERLAWKPTKLLDDKTAHIFKKAYSLKLFSKQLRSLEKKKYIPKRAESFADFTFWAMKLWAEDEIRNYGLIAYENFENWALSQFVHKEKSTIRAKARSIWNYYYERDWKLPKHNEKKYETIEKWYEDSRMTRAEHMKKLNRKREEESYKKVVNTITGLYANEYKKKNGKWNISKIARELGMHRDTVSKHLKVFEEKLKP